MQDYGIWHIPLAWVCIYSITVYQISKYPEVKYVYMNMKNEKGKYYYC